MSLSNISYTLTRLIVVIVLLVTLHAYGLAREFVWYLTKKINCSQSCNFFYMEEFYSYKEKIYKKDKTGNNKQQHNNKKIYNYVQL